MVEVMKKKWRNYKQYRRIPWSRYYSSCPSMAIIRNDEKSYPYQYKFAFGIAYYLESKTILKKWFFL